MTQLLSVSLYHPSSVLSQILVLSSEVAHHAWVQTSGAGIRRCRKISIGKWDSPELNWVNMQIIVLWWINVKSVIIKNI